MDKQYIKLSMKQFFRYSVTDDDVCNIEAY